MNIKYIITYSLIKYLKDTEKEIWNNDMKEMYTNKILKWWMF
jgi:hypothetical protein